MRGTDDEGNWKERSMSLRERKEVQTLLHRQRPGLVRSGIGADQAPPSRGAGRADVAWICEEPCGSGCERACVARLLAGREPSGGLSAHGAVLHSVVSLRLDSFTQPVARSPFPFSLRTDRAHLSCSKGRSTGRLPKIVYSNCLP